MTIRAVTFDYGGTLDGAGSHWLDRFVALYGEAGLDEPFERVKAAFYAADEAAYAEPRLAKAGLRELMEFHVGVQLGELGRTDPRLREFLVDRFVTASRAALAESRSVLQRLRKRFRLGVISNFYGNVDCILAEAGIAPLLNVIVDSGRVGFSKPDPRIFAHAVARLGVPAAETLHVGDSYERDVAAARRAGLRAAWLVGAQPPVEPSDRAVEACFASLEELAERVDGRV